MKTTVINSDGTSNTDPLNNKAGSLTGAGSAATTSNGGSPVGSNMDFDKPSGDKAEIKSEKAAKASAAAVKPARNLDSTIKLALDLTRRINQRGKLLETISTLEAFEVAQQDDAVETDVNFYQGCTLTIEDDNDREFSTKNPFIIKAVAAEVHRLCVDKLAEIESEIFIPA